MNDFGEFLYKLRKEKGMTQAELADELGITNKAVSKWETGESMPETSQLLPLSRIFGVTVDELLSGKRAEKFEYTDTREAKKTGEQTYEYTKAGERTETKASYSDDGQARTEGYANIDDDALDPWDNMHMHGHIFEKQNVRDRICGAICSAVVLLGVTVYMLLGGIANLWYPYWVIIPTCALTAGIVGVVFDMGNARKRAQKLKRGENPYTGGVCGIVMLVCVMLYLILGVTTDLWHPLWVIPACGGVSCGIIGAVGDAFVIKNNKNKDKE
ncbi:MAG: helix-turn-helix domain-containing protein [Clostridia bacterium]|nr:helix-turn-helix domain-containing protein [Clostridia bacterium]